MADDKRRSQYVPLTSKFGHDRFSVKITEKFGRDGLLVWALYLAACKRATYQGEFEYVSESDGWTRLGLSGMEPGFTLRDFFTYTGQLKKTSRRTSGRVTHVLCTPWKDWNNDLRRQQDASQKAWKRAENPATTQRRNTDERTTEGEGEGEERKTLSTREETTVRTDAPLRCCAPVKTAEQRHGPDRPCRLTFRNERELRSHLSVVHWLEDDEIAAALAQPRLAVVEAAS